MTGRDPGARYLRVAAQLRARIVAGEWPVGSQLAGKRDLAQAHGVAVGTLERALLVLRDEGLIEIVHGAGTFVRSATPAPRLSTERRLASLESRVSAHAAGHDDRIREIVRELLAGSEGEPSTVPEPQPVVAAVVTSGLGVLVCRRVDGRPPWAFVSGEIEPGESPADAAVREVKEESGLEVRPGRQIGRRVHPDTGRTMIYIAATPAAGTDVTVCDERELAEVRWAGLAEAHALLPGMFGAVHEYLSRVMLAR